MRFSAEQIEAVIAGKPITDMPPWSLQDDTAVEKFVVNICENLSCNFGLNYKVDLDRSGSGYVSFIDAWFYRESDEFRYASSGHYYRGFVVLFSKLSNFFVFGEGDKSWDNTSGSSYVPEFEMVDKFTRSCNKQLEKPIEEYLSASGLSRLFAHELSDILVGYEVKTILADEPLREFDALFYWEED